MINLLQTLVYCTEQEKNLRNEVLREIQKILLMQFTYYPFKTIS